MGTTLGYESILNLALPTGVDGTRLAQWELATGETFQQFTQRLATALAAVNAEFERDWGHLFFTTEEQMMEYRNGGTPAASAEVTDIDVVDPTHETTIGHQIALPVYQEMIGGTDRWFMDARTVQLTTDIGGKIDNLRKRFETDLLNRAFKTTESAVGTSGYNVPWVYSTTGTVDYVPPAYNGETFASTHSHFLGVDSNSYTFADMLNQMAETIQEHGHDGTYFAIVSRTDISSYRDLADFIRPQDQMITHIDRASETSGPNYYTTNQLPKGVIGGFSSDYGEIQLYATARVPTGHAFLTKSYGQQSPKNPFAVRIRSAARGGKGFGCYIAAVTGDSTISPIKLIRMEFEYGLGLGADRTNGVSAYRVAGGTYADPTIS
jgi:hypothetical protein